MCWLRRVLAWWAALVLAASTCQASAWQADEDQWLVLQATIDGQMLSDSLTAYQDDQRFLLPLGELARLLTLAITVDAAAGTASGFVISEERNFGLHVSNGVVDVGGRTRNFAERDVRVIGDDIYVSHTLLSLWLPVDVVIDLPRLQLRIRPRETLPMQARWQRERAGATPLPSRGNDNADHMVPQVAPYGLLDAPFIDQTFGGDARYGGDSAQYRTAYSAYMTADVLGMEGQAYVNVSRDRNRPELRWTLGRRSPEAQLLGPLQATSFSLGHVVLPSMQHVQSTSADGMGLSVSNRPLGQPTNFDRHSFNGDLPPGWDVTLFYNDALVAYQAAGQDGRYAFDDLPLSIGPNEFLLVFNGPLGQTRLERHNFLLDQSLMQPGQFHYTVSAQDAELGATAGAAQFEVGLTKSVSAYLNVLHKRGHGHNSDELGDVVQTGARFYSQGAIMKAQVTQSSGSGWLADVNLKTRLYGHAVFWEHVRRSQHFVSDLYVGGKDGLQRRDRVGIQGTSQWGEGAPLSLGLDVSREAQYSGATQTAVALRASTLLASTAITNSLRWQRTQANSHLDGSVQLSRRVFNVGLSGQIDVAIKPQATLRTAALTVDHVMGGGFRLTGGLLYSKLADTLHLSAGVSKNFDGCAAAVTMGGSSKGERTVGLQLFVALGRDPRTGDWLAEPQPLAGTGAVSLQAFVDRNMNGVRDPEEEAVRRAGFILNHGGRHPGRTNEQGQLMVQRLAPGQYADIELDASTLEDPQWKSVLPGVRVLPRPGLVQVVDFPVVYTAEVEGTVYLVDEYGQKRGIGDAQVELVNAAGEVIAHTRSSADGYYLLHQVPPGAGTLRIAPEQVHKLGLSGMLKRSVHAPADGDFLSGQDLLVKVASKAG